MGSEFDKDKWMIDVGLSNASNSQPPTDMLERMRWEENTRIRSLADSSGIPPGTYAGQDVNLGRTGAGAGSSGGGAKWRDLPKDQQADARVALALVALMLVVCVFWKGSGLNRVEGLGDVAGVAIFSLLAYAVLYGVLRLGRLCLRAVQWLAK